MDAAYDEKAAAFPQHFPIYREWSAFLEGQGRVQQARQVLLLVQPPTPASLTRLGLLELRQGRVEVAHRRLEQATKLATKNSVPSLSDTAIRLARSLVKEGDSSKASQILTSALSTDRSNSELFRELVNVSVQNNNDETTVKLCEDAIKSVRGGDKIFFEKERIRQAEVNCVGEEELINLDKTSVKPVMKSFKCDMCGVLFSSKWNLLTHQKIHNRVQFTSCKKCLVECDTNAALKTHAAKCRSYVCECGFQANKSSQMKSHKLMHN